MASLLPPSTPDVPLATPPLSSVLNPPPNTNTPPMPPATPSKNDTSTTPTTSPPAPPASDSSPPSSSPPSPAVVASPPPSASASSPPPDASSPPPPVLSTPPEQSPPPPAQSPPPTQSPPPPTITSPPPSSSPPPPSPTSPPPPPQESPATPPPQDSPSPPPPPQKSSPPPKASPSPPPPPAETTPPTATPSVPPPTTHSPPPPIDTSPPPSAIPPPPHAISPPPPDSASSPPSSSVIPTSPSPPAPPPPRKAISPPNIQRHSPPPPKPSDSSLSGLPVILGVTAVVGVFFLTCFVVFIWCLKTRRKRRDDAYSGGGMYGHPQFTPTSSVKSDQQLIGVYTSPPESGFSYGSSGLVGGGGNSSPPKGGTGLSSSNSSFNYEELAAATNGFAPENILGEGGFGCVYKGTLPDGRVIAVKQLKSGGGQGEREFRAEVETISRIHHRHLVSLVGYCIHGYQRLLVYAFVANGNLEHHLHGKNVPVMSWETRMKIAIGAARGLAYLHEDCHPRIIHRDIKSANILIDDNFEAQVADFGLAKLAVDTHTHVSTRVMGTFGYLAPEYAASGKLTDKSDVYSFGVVLLELVTGRKPVDISQPIGEESLVEWARPIFSRVLEEGNFFDVVDSRLENNFNEAEMFRMIEAAGACVRHSSNRRPKMGQVVRALETNSATSDLNNGFKPGQSMMFDAGQQSSEIRRFRQMAFGSKEFSTEYSDGVSDYGTDRYSSEFKRDFENRHTRQYSTDSQRNRDYDRQSRQYSNDDFPRNRDFEYRQSRQHNPDFQRNRDFDSKPSRQSGMRAESSFPYAPDSPSSSVESETLPIHRYRSYQEETSERSSDEVPVGFKKENLAGR